MSQEASPGGFMAGGNRTQEAPAGRGSPRRPQEAPGNPCEYPRRHAHIRRISVAKLPKRCCKVTESALQCKKLLLLRPLWFYLHFNMFLASWLRSSNFWL